ncbi:SH3 domain-containing protein [Shouchella sp. 1P09AA]|uniref:SH3 domain-containing protein n=1 Tax=unclassified Shouchella TaxID=2893065 RepID=UPI00399FAC9C
MFIIKKKILITSGSASALTLIATALPLQTTLANSYNVVENHYPISFSDAVDRQMGLSAPPQTDKNGRWQNASRNDVAYYMNPSNFSQGTSSYLQFLDLTSSAGLSAQAINSQLLSNKGILSGHGQTFINASKLHGVNEIYLISHALLETGNGGSQLARGVQYNGRTVYNMYGIGAFDGNAVQAGARYAYNQGWFTPEDAIIGGSRFVSNNYFGRGQTTLYKMRWNPSTPGTHQYATDVGWAVKQTHQMANLYGMVDNYNLQFSLPVYNNQPGGNQQNDNELEPLPPNTYGTTTARLNVRTGPGTSHSIVTTLNKDQKVDLIAKSGQWYKIKAGNVEGYVSEQFLSIAKDSEDQIDEIDEDVIAEGKTTARLNLRSQPNTSSSIRTTLSKGQTVQIVKQEGNWYFVRVGFQTGWVSSEFVSTSSENVDNGNPSLGSATTTARLNLRSGAGTSHRVLTTLPIGQKLELLQKQGNWYQVKAGNQTGWVSSEFVSTSNENVGDNNPSLGSATTTARLNLRSGAGTSHRVLTTLPVGQKLELLQKQGNWYQVKAGNQTGWVSSEFVSTSNENVGDNNPSLGSATTTARLNLRSGAGTSHRVLTTLPVGQKLELLQKQGNWYQVKAGNQTGWVSAEFIQTSGGNNVDNSNPSLGSATTTARLNLRSGAGTSHRVLTTLPVGQKLELLQKQGNWYQVKAGNQTGWVSAEFVQASGGNNVDNSNPSLGSATTTARLNLRSGAGTSHRVLTTLPVGQKLELLQKQGNWYQVKAGNQTGWVSSEFVQTSGGNNIDNSNPSLGSATTTARLNLRSGAGTSHRVLTTLPVGQKLELLQKQGNWYQVKAGNQTGWVSAEFVQTSGGNNVDNSNPSLGSATTTARLNLRSGAGTSHRVLTTLPVGQKLELLQKQGNWYQVKAGNQTGWVSAEFIQTSGGNNVDNSNPSLGSATTTARLNLRSGAGTSHRVLTTLPVGQKLELLQKQGNWYQVKAGNQTGWVSAEFLSMDKAAPSQEATVSKAGETTARVNLRSGAGTSHRVLTTLNKGQAVEILKTESGWHQVKVGSQTGWVSAQYVSERKAAPSIQAMSRSLMGPMFIQEHSNDVETDISSSPSSKENTPTEKEVASISDEDETSNSSQNAVTNTDENNVDETSSVDNDEEINTVDKFDNPHDTDVDETSSVDNDEEINTVDEFDNPHDTDVDETSSVDTDEEINAVDELDNSHDTDVDETSSVDNDEEINTVDELDNPHDTDVDETSSVDTDEEINAVDELDNSHDTDVDETSSVDTDKEMNAVDELDNSHDTDVDENLGEEIFDAPEMDKRSSDEEIEQNNDHTIEEINEDRATNTVEQEPNDIKELNSAHYALLTDTSLLLSADSESETLVQLSEGQEVDVLEEKSGFIKIKVNNQEGWIISNSLNL